MVQHHFCYCCSNENGSKSNSVRKKSNVEKELREQEEISKRDEEAKKASKERDQAKRALQEAMRQENQAFHAYNEELARWADAEDLEDANSTVYNMPESRFQEYVLKAQNWHTKWKSAAKLIKVSAKLSNHFDVILSNHFDVIQGYSSYKMRSGSEVDIRRSDEEKFFKKDAEIQEMYKALKSQ